MDQLTEKYQTAMIWEIGIIASAAYLGAVANRERGDGDTPSRPAMQMVLAFPYALMAGLSWQSNPMFLIFANDDETTISLCVGFAVFVITTLAFITGPGQYFLERVIKPLDSPQFVDPLVRLFFGPDPRWIGGESTSRESILDRVRLYGMTRLYWRCTFGMSLTGLIVTVPAGLITLNPWLAASGLLKAPAYMIAHRMGHGIELAEYLTGAALWGVVAAIAFFL